MGCDIHMHAFQKVGSSYFCIDGRYISNWASEELRYRHTYSDRNYLVFSILAGVRNGWDIEPISEPRGLPVWAKLFARDDIYDFGEHSHSWLTIDEIYRWSGWKKQLKPYEDEKKQPLSETCSNFLWVCHDLKFLARDYEHPTDIILVFGFDS